MADDNVECPKCGDDSHVTQYHLDVDTMHLWCSEHGYLIVTAWSETFKPAEPEEES